MRAAEENLEKMRLERGIDQKKHAEPEKDETVKMLERLHKEF